MQERHNSIANALELSFSCTNPSMCAYSMGCTTPTARVLPQVTPLLCLFQSTHAPCPECGKNIRKKNMKGHIRQMHLREKPYICGDCHKAFSQRGNMMCHIRQVHLREKPFVCGHCHQTFSQGSNLRRHLAAVHDDYGNRSQKLELSTVH